MDDAGDVLPVWAALRHAHSKKARDNNVMHTKPDLRLFLKWMIAGSGSVITDVITLTIAGRLAVLEIKHNACKLTINGVEHELERPVISSATDGERVFVVFDYMTYPKNSPVFNLVALDKDANLLWTVAEHPISSPIAAYVNIINVSPLTVGNWTSCDCILDAKTGALISSRFTK